MNLNDVVDVVLKSSVRGPMTFNMAKACTQERYLLFLMEDVAQDAKKYLKECIELQGLVVEEEACPEQEVIVVGAPFCLLAEEVGVVVSTKF